MVGLGVFEVYGAEVVEGAVASAAVVDGLDPGGDSHHRCLPGGELVSVVELGFEGGPE